MRRPGNESFRVLFKFSRSGWDQRLADFNRFSRVETRSCYSCLVLYLHASGYAEVHSLDISFFVCLFLLYCMFWDRINFLVNDYLKTVFYRWISDIPLLRFIESSFDIKKLRCWCIYEVLTASLLMNKKGVVWQRNNGFLLTYTVSNVFPTKKSNFETNPYIFIANYQFFQITPTRYTLSNEKWHALLNEEYFSKHHFLDTSPWVFNMYFKFIISQHEIIMRTVLN